MENMKEALEYLVNLGEKNAKTELVLIGGKTYVPAVKRLEEYSKMEYASPVHSLTLVGLIDYIKHMSREFRDDMFIHISSPTEVKLVSALDEERKRECLFKSSAEVSAFQFNTWYNQENFVLALQTEFEATPDLEAVMKMAGNIEAKTVQNYSDDGVSQKAVISHGIASKEDAIVPNPVILRPYRTFQEVEQPESNFVFRISDNGEPKFKLVEAEGGLWKNVAMGSIKLYLEEMLQEIDRADIPVIA